MIHCHHYRKFYYTDKLNVHSFGSIGWCSNRSGSNDYQILISHAFNLIYLSATLYNLALGNGFVLVTISWKFWKISDQFSRASMRGFNTHKAFPILATRWRATKWSMTLCPRYSDRKPYSFLSGFSLSCNCWPPATALRASWLKLPKMGTNITPFLRGANYSLQRGAIWLTFDFKSLFLKPGHFTDILRSARHVLAQGHPHSFGASMFVKYEKQKFCFQLHTSEGVAHPSESRNLNWTQLT